MTILAKIGRPPIDREYLTIEETVIPGRYAIRRYKKLSVTRSALRVLDVQDLQADTLVHDLLGAIEAVTADFKINLDSRGLTGREMTLRERFARLAAMNMGSGT